MYTLNLSKDLTPTVSNEIHYDYFVFPGGEPSIKITPPIIRFDTNSTVNINIKILSFNDIGKLYLGVDALRRIGFKNINLFLPYFPGARQDRIMVDGEALTVKIYTDLINALNFNKVTILDPHSDVCVALLDNVEVIDNHVFVSNVLHTNGILKSAEFNLISPDAGSNKKIKELAKYLTLEGYKPVIVKCDKTRDVATGKITGFEVYGEIKDLPSFIVDDICDGGGTFLGLGSVLKEKGITDLHLVTTHGIYSKGSDILLKMFKSVSCTNSFVDMDYGDLTDVVVIKL